ncbi:GH24 family phage-related lysozyme (muramidase) [Clostridium acetobutylicum]|nr:GH24 family phage-related lysozyme (muramidase) [Clostridium acetobutylicum]NOW16471.1 GH24 family phage-related lysozyme (muramidase) [Clostridium acetobutylicum]
MGLLFAYMSKCNIYADTKSITLNPSVATTLGKTDNTWTFQVGDYNNDGVPDLYGISKQGTNSTEVHVLDGKSNYRKFLLQTAIPIEKTGDNYDFKLGDYNNDGVPDLYCIKKNGSNGKTEVHILNGKDNFHSFLAEVATALPATDNNWSFSIGDYNHDGTPDLYCIKKNGANGKTELHILNGKNNFQSFLYEVGTTLPQTDNNWDFGVSDYNADGALDLYCIKKNGSGATEVHILDGKSNFKSFAFEIGTPMTPTDENTQFILGQGSMNIYAIKKQGATATEVQQLGYKDTPNTSNDSNSNTSTKVNTAPINTNGINWKSHFSTALGKTDDTWTFQMGDYNRDGVLDLYGIRKQGTTSTEVHVLDGKSNYRKFLLQTVIPIEKTGDNYDFKLSDYNNDGIPDLYCIKKNGANGRTEVHVLNGKDNFHSFFSEVSTALPSTDNNWDFCIGNYNNDEKPDLYCIKKNGANGKTEVHILNGKTNFQSFLLEIGTSLSNTDDNWNFGLNDYNNDGLIDLYCIKRNGSGATEIHILNGKNNFSSFNFESATPMEPTDKNTQFIVSNDGALNVYPIKKQGATSTEVHEFGTKSQDHDKNYNNSSNLITFIGQYESFSPVPYRGADYQNRTIGYGHVIQPGENLSYLTDEQARDLLQRDIQNTTNAVSSITSGLKLTQNQFDSLVDFAYNCGISALESSILLKNIKAGNTSADTLKTNFISWSYCNGEELLGLWRRRMDEWQMYEYSDYNRDYPNW